MKINRSVFKGVKGTTSEFTYGLISSRKRGEMMESSFEEDSFDCSVCEVQRKWGELGRAVQKEKVTEVKEDGY